MVRHPIPKSKRRDVEYLSFWLLVHEFLVGKIEIVYP